MKFIIKLTFSESWEIDYEGIDPELIVSDALRKLPKGVGYEIINKRKILTDFLNWQQKKCHMPYDASISSQIEAFEAFNYVQNTERNGKQS